MNLILFKTTPVRSLVLTAFMGLSVAACDGQSALILDQTDTLTSPAVETQSAQDDQPGAAIESAVVDNVVTNETAGQAVDPESLLSEIASTGSIRLMPMGDSITQGVLGAKSYRFELKNLIADSGCSMRFVGSQSANLPATDFYLAHEGYSGHPADFFLAGTRANNAGVVSAVSYQKPDVVLLHVGSVDIFLGHDVASTLAEIHQIVAAIESTKPGTLVFLANLIPWVSTEAGADRPALIQELGTQIEAYVSESNNPYLHIVDVRSGFENDMLQSDLIHPNQLGDAHIADAFFDQIYSANYCN